VIASKTVGGPSAIALLTIAATAATARAECKPTAIAEGDPALVQTLVPKLEASGIATTTSAGCPAVRVSLEQRGDQLHVKLLDAFARAGERDVQDIATAAAIVESWTYQEIEQGSLPADAPPPSIVAVAPPISRPRGERFAIAASATSGLGTNGGTTWLGGSISACVRIGPLCAGAMLRATADTRATGDTSGTFAQDSYELSALAMIDVPRRLGSFLLIPGIGVGYGYQHVTAHHHDPTGNPVDIATPDHELRGGVHAALARSIGAHLAVFADLWADAAFAHSASMPLGPTGALSLAFGARVGL
jgi:hypothetical protein